MTARREPAHLTEHRKQAFITELARHGVAIRAARAASPGSTTGALTTFKDERKRDAEFAAAWDEAIENAHASLLEELIRRARDGVDVPLQDAKGNVVGWKKQYSDKLLLAAVTARFREFTPRSEVTAKVSQEPSLGLDQLSVESQDQLREILEREQRRALSSAEVDSNATPAADRLPIEERER